MKVLLVEDEPGLVSVIVRGLTDAGMEVSVAADGIMGLEMAQTHKFDIILLDIMLPGMNGIQVCKEIRKRDDGIAILMLTALNSTENIVTGLNSGADDYLAKPFKFAELEARIRTLVRRSKAGNAPKNVITVANLEIDTVSKTAKRAGKAISLTATEYHLLEYFAKNQNRVLSRIQILENVWDIDFNMGTNVVDVYVNYLRKKVDTGYDAKLIHTVFGMGYIFKEEVNEASN
ncbi:MULTISPECIES: response regulator transcription factor [unclassified Mucilaginibacter]|uniref:response regulator transcription factor n=1 Tax=unclassified Mucilaginibacter TaxID=2617802 RepID=UPI002AC91E62|nr:MULTISPECIES: response regulator transcription factor [unclassified Mucilaginibacter]MEB0263172.1 response regulator transcription factor [Mucilaginibacter sp. 10I4]MEB0278142.1 response regulator transcription factor [Mucilaginibacter sp. 10B2]MEB0301376.1 response regulator transcription factor [Mucilaginibacter sp. 5C4]WPX23054.1 response regulator transcription factor [Mucilaginibacter sp. 5C4]